MITLLMIPRVLETCWNLMKKRGYVPKNDMILGQIVLYGVVMGIINLFYQNKQEAINPSYLKAFKALWGVN